MPRKPVPVMIDGVRYESQSDAARALGVSRMTIWSYVNREKYNQYHREYYRSKTEGAVRPYNRRLSAKRYGPERLRNVTLADE